MAIKISGTTVIDDSRNLTNVGGLKTVGGVSILGSGDIPAGGLESYSSAPSSPSAGDMYFNTTQNQAFIYSENAWRPLHSMPVTATGGTTYTSGGYKYHKFTSSGNFVVTRGGDLEYLLVAGGGPGGGRYYSGGGGAGGYVSGSLTVTAQTYSIVVGAGGAGQTQSSRAYGNNTSGLGQVDAVRGGGGGSYSTTNAGLDGGSGGGRSGYSNYSGNVGAGTTGQGHNGGNGGQYGAGGGGGGSYVGANGTSTSGGNGGTGTGLFSDWATATSSGQNGYFCGGGGGGAYNGSRGAGGLGGGGSGGYISFGPASGTANTGGGGGGAYTETTSGAGGSGIVIVRYLV